MKQILLSFLVLATTSTAMEREKKRPYEGEQVSSNPKGRPFDFHSHYQVISPKKQVVSSENFISLISQSDHKTIGSLFELQKVAFDHRLEFFTEAALAIFCKNDQLSPKDKTMLLTCIKQDAAHMKYKFMRRASVSIANSEVQEPKNSTLDEWRNEFKRKQLDKLQQACKRISNEDKSKMAITNAIIKHLHALATIQKINETNAKTLGLGAPLIVPHNLYLGYACEQAEKSSNPDVINFLNAQDTAQNRTTYKKWLEHHTTPGNK